MKKICLGLLIGIIFIGSLSSLPSGWQAEEQAKRFAQAINANRPIDLYPRLLPEIREGLTVETFIDNFTEERSYPYLSPLYIYLDDIKLSPDKNSGEAIFTVAARLPGEKMNIALHYINGQYYLDAFRDIADGSYRKKFEKL